MNEDLTIEQFMVGLIKRNPNESEFHQAVKEVAESVIPFINKNPKYKHIKITNIILLVLFMLADMYAAAVDGARFSPLASLITFWIARAIIRNIFIKNSDFNYKIITTVGVYIGTFIIKTVILIYILNLIL